MFILTIQWRKQYRSAKYWQYNDENNTGQQNTDNTMTKTIQVSKILTIQWPKTYRSAKYWQYNDQKHTGQQNTDNTMTKNIQVSKILTIQWPKQYRSAKYWQYNDQNKTGPQNTTQKTKRWAQIYVSFMFNKFVNLDFYTETTIRGCAINQCFFKNNKWV
jgi:hypothetical protein